ncbi:MAG: tRNA preQ1(34) S-adenosylmethionine ribosyltransferase-isomerase QueA [Thermomicrobiales bacterium]
MKTQNTDLLVADFDYELPPGLIAQEPLPDRSGSRLLVVDRERNSISHDALRNIGRWLRPGDLLVANNSRVLAARLEAVKRDSGGRIELLLLHPNPDGDWTALARPAKKLKSGSLLIIEPRPRNSRPPAEIEVIRRGEEGEVTVRISMETMEHLADFGAVPLPPYIRHRLEDPERYQTVYATAPGSAAAPTAGLHLTKELIEELQGQGIKWAEVTLHIGLDTFRPVSVERVEDHKIHSEWCSVSRETAAQIRQAKDDGQRVIAVGTTAARTLETLGDASKESFNTGLEGPTDIFITPGYTWRVVDALLTNFHLPRSTLLMMISALAGRELILSAYQAAIAERYRFYSFGDAMLIV